MGNDLAEFKMTDAKLTIPLVILCCLGITLGFIVGVCLMAEHIHTSAKEAGVGEWHLNDQDQKEWRWKTHD